MSAIKGSVETEGVSPQVEQPEKFWSCNFLFSKKKKKVFKTACFMKILI